MSPGAVSFGADALPASKAALAGAMSTTCVSRRTSPTNGWPPRSNVPTLNGDRRAARLRVRALTAASQSERRHAECHHVLVALVTAEPPGFQGTAYRRRSTQFYVRKPAGFADIFRPPIVAASWAEVDLSERFGAETGALG